MTWPADDLTVVNFASGSDPSQARAEILAAINKLKAVLAQYNVASGLCPLGADSKVPSANLPALNYLPLAGGVLAGAVDEAQGADIASAATLNLEAATGNVVDVTGTTTVTAITLSQGACRTVRFTGALMLTNGASLVLPGAANITTAAGDYARFRGYAGGVVRCEAYQRASGAALGGVVTSFNGRQGAVTLAYGDVTAALGSGIVGGLNSDLLDGYHANNLPYAGQNYNFTWTTISSGSYLSANATMNFSGNWGYGIYMVRGNASGGFDGLELCNTVVAVGPEPVVYPYVDLPSSYTTPTFSSSSTGIRATSSGYYAIYKLTKAA